MNDDDEDLIEWLIALGVSADVGDHNWRACHERGMRGYDFAGADRAAELVRETEDRARLGWLRRIFPWVD